MRSGSSRNWASRASTSPFLASSKCAAFVPGLFVVVGSGCWVITIFQGGGLEK